MRFIHVLRLIGCWWLLAAAFGARLGHAAEATPFAIGQEWSYQTRDDERASRLVILRIDPAPKHDGIVHVGIIGASLRLKRGGPVQPWPILHLPFAGKALRRSVTKLERARSEAVFPEFETAYADWQRQSEAKGNQFWTVPVARAIADLETMIQTRAK